MSPVLRGALPSSEAGRTEPLPKDHPFWHDPRVHVTPHIAARTLRDESIEQIAGKVAQLMRGESITGVVERSRGY